MRFLGLFVLTLSSVFAQGTQTVFQKVFTNAVATGISAPVRNTGAQYNQLTVTATNATAGSCTAWQGIIRMEASFDNITYESFGPPITNLATNQTLFISAIGAFGYVRVNLATTISACAITAYYSGSTSGYPNGSAPTTVMNDSVIVAPTVHSTAVRTSSPITGGVSCYGTAAPQIYGLTVSNTGNASNTVTLSAVYFPSTAVDLIKVVVVNGTPPIIWNPSDRAIFTSPPGTTSTYLGYSTSSNSETYIAASYRCE